MPASSPQPASPPAPRLALAVALLAVAAAAVACPCDPDPSVDRRGRPVGADAGEAPARLAWVPEHEPNDEPGAATLYDLVPTAPGSTAFKPFQGELASASDVDFVQLPAQGDVPLRTLRLESLTPGADLTLLWGDAEHPQDLVPADRPEEVLNLAPGAAIVGVRAAPGAAFPVKWRLSLARSLQRQGIEVEPGPEAGIPLVVPGELQGLINHKGDVDRFKLEVGDDAAGRALRLEVQPPAQGSIEVTLMVDGVALDTVTVGAPAAPEAPPVEGGKGNKGKGNKGNRRLGKGNADEDEAPAVDPRRPATWPNLRMEPGKPFVIEVRGADEASGHAAAYTVRALLHPEPAEGFVLETEPCSVLQPMVIEGSGRFSGYLHVAEDRDVYVLTVEPPDDDEAPPTILSARLEGEGMNWGMNLNTPAARGASTEEAIDGAGAGEPEIICNLPVSAGETRLELFYSAPASKAEIKAQSGNPLGGYRLIVEARLAADEEIEPNAQRDEASALTPGAARRGWVFPQGDVDAWRFEVSAPPEGSAPKLEVPKIDLPDGVSPPPKIRVIPGLRGAPGGEPRDRPEGGLPGLQGNPGVPGGLPGVKVPSLDLDPLGLTPPAPTTRKVSLELKGTRLNLALEVVDEEGLPVARVDGAPAGGSERLELDLPPGVYYALVKAGPKLAACDAPYTLELTLP